jgi:predicted DNA-binding antitoxin AbrB/MazE fold protein
MISHQAFKYKSMIEMGEREAMATFTILAIYEEGKLRPLKPLPLQEQESVPLRVIQHSAVQETTGILRGLTSEVVQEVAEGDECSIIA